jgi:hypothetical protein
MEPVPANTSLPEPVRGKRPGFLVTFVVTLAVLEVLVVAAVVLPNRISAPSAVKLRAVHTGMSQQELVSLLGEPQSRSFGVWHYPLRIGFGDYENFLTFDTFQVTFGEDRKVLYAYCGD